MMPSTDSSVTFVLPGGVVLGGSNTWSINMCRRLSLAGSKTVLVEHAPRERHAPLGEQVDRETIYLKCGLPCLSDAGIEDIKRFADEYSIILPAVLIPNDYPAAYAIAAELASRDPGSVRVIGVGHADTEKYYDQLSYYEPILHVMIAVNSAMCDQVRIRFPHRVQDILLKSCPVEVPDVCHTQYSGEGEPLQIVYAGRITNYDKGAGHLVPLAEKLHDYNVPFRLRIFGDGPYMNCLQQDLAKTLAAVRECIELNDPVSHVDMRSIWESADIVLQPSNYESTGLSMLEGMASCRVPVVTDCNGPRDIIKNGENGFMVPKGDVVAMAEAIRSLHNERGLLETIGRKAFDTVRDGYSYDQYLPWFQTLRQRLWDMKPRGWDASRSLLSPEKRISLLRKVARRLRSIMSRS